MEAATSGPGSGIIGSKEASGPARKREVVMTARGKLGRFLKLLAPGLVEDMALAALAEDVKPH